MRAPNGSKRQYGQRRLTGEGDHVVCDCFEEIDMDGLRIDLGSAMLCLEPDCSTVLMA
jgi:hypothetical protein